MNQQPESESISWNHLVDLKYWQWYGSEIDDVTMPPDDANYPDS